MPYSLSTALLMIAMGGAWLDPKRRFSVWPAVFTTWLACAITLGQVSPIGAAGLGLLAACAWMATTPRHLPGGRATRFIAIAVTLALAMVLAIHRWPGFVNPQVLPVAPLTPDAVPFPLWISFDKAAAGFLLLLFFPRCLSRLDLRAALPRAAAVAAVAIPAIMGLACLLGIVRWEPKWLAITPVFLMVNLMFSCLVEEMFFRGILQARLQQYLTARFLARRRLAYAVAIGATTLLFTAAHAGASPAMQWLIGMAGASYGLAYALTGRLGAAVFVHAALNLTHFVFFTYPQLAAQ